MRCNGWLFNGTDSYFSATLTGKLLRKIAKEYSYKEFISKRPNDFNNILEGIVRQLFFELRAMKNSLQLQREEVLNTLLISVIDSKNRYGEFLCVGDGLICINGEFYEFEQDNRPDYLGYHLDEYFDTWYANQKQRITAKDIKDFSLASDGIFTFRKFNNELFQEPGDVVNFLLTDTVDNQNFNMLDRKRIEIEKEWGLKPTDDLAIVRGIL